MLLDNLLANMMEGYADGTFKCFKCKNKRQVQSFLYNDICEGKKPGDVFVDYVEHVHAWACEDCFLKSGFCRVLCEGEDVKSKVSDRWPDTRHEDLTKCIHCEMYWPFWNYSSYNAWRFDSGGKRMEAVGPEQLHAFIREKKMIWGCSRCYKQSGLNAHMQEGNARWMAYKPTGEDSWADMAKHYKQHGDYQAVD